MSEDKPLYQPETYKISAEELSYLTADQIAALVPPPLDTSTMGNFTAVQEAELAMAAKLSKAKRIAWLNRQTHKKHKYRGIDPNDGSTHEFEHMPGLSYKVVISSGTPQPTTQHLLGSPIVAEIPPDEINYCGSLRQAELCFKSAIRSGRIAKIIPVEKVEDPPNGG